MIDNRKNLLLAASVIIALNFQSCSKYEEGPKFSLRTKANRLKGDWEVVRIGNQMFPSGGYSLEMSFEKGGDFSFNYSYGFYSYGYFGEWEFSSDKEDLRLFFDNELQTFEILRLTNKELWMESNISNEEWRLEAK
ncbi:hypothetical protein CW751_05000 [Brumimicrobium salinarum]|uniref:Lipocalin-like domain-containing protein n=1 Tax=Brumimicrobium salinarum TaxID=2058658 RepID=A0A2I0R4B2_9FLAO|nr:hypothetical protein [Brumimicrobium salinarum]PKR81416.1 hypothetical protein CW751_05000 [Brumimicrobium salinarum]